MTDHVQYSPHCGGRSRGPSTPWYIHRPIICKAVKCSLGAVTTRPMCSLNDHYSHADTGSEIGLAWQQMRLRAISHRLHLIRYLSVNAQRHSFRPSKPSIPYAVNCIYPNTFLFKTLNAEPDPVFFQCHSLPPALSSFFESSSLKLLIRSDCNDCRLKRIAVKAGRTISRADVSAIHAQAALLRYPALLPGGCFSCDVPSTTIV